MFELVDYNSSSATPWRIISKSLDVQSTTVDTSVLPMPPSITRSTSAPYFSSISSGSVSYSTSVFPTAT